MHAGRGEAVEGIYLGALPGFFLHLASVARAFFHGARAAAVLGFAAFGVIDRLAKAALVRFLVDLGAAYLVAAAHDEDHGFFAAHELADHRVDETVFDQRFEARGDFHSAIMRAFAVSGCDSFNSPLCGSLTSRTRMATVIVVPAQAGTQEIQMFLDTRPGLQPAGAGSHARA